MADPCHRQHPDPLLLPAARPLPRCRAPFSAAYPWSRSLAALLAAALWLTLRRAATPTRRWRSGSRASRSTSRSAGCCSCCRSSTSRTRAPPRRDHAAGDPDPLPGRVRHPRRGLARAADRRRRPAICSCASSPTSTTTSSSARASASGDAKLLALIGARAGLAGAALRDVRSGSLAGVADQPARRHLVASPAPAVDAERSNRCGTCRSRSARSWRRRRCSTSSLAPGCSRSRRSSRL